MTNFTPRPASAHTANQEQFIHMTAETPMDPIGTSILEYYRP